MKKEEEVLELDQTLSKSEQFVEKNWKAILAVVAAVVVVVAGYFGVKSFIIEPNNESASDELVSCEKYMAMDSLKLALEGDNNECIGFLGIIDEYGHTKAGNLAKAYAGLCYSKLGQNEEALEYLKKFSTDEENADAAIQLRIADCYVNLDQNEEALKVLGKVAGSKHDVFAPQALKKMGVIYEAEKNNEEALKAYEQIKEDYPQAIEAQDIDKYIARLK